MKLHGAIGTNMESEMHEAVYEIEAVSTGKIFCKAAEQGIAIHILDDPETLEAGLAVISAPSVVKNHIRTYVNAGYAAIIPQRNITVGSWSGQGWVVVNEETGAAGYMICGGLRGEVINGGSLSETIDNLFASILKALKKTHAKADASIIEYTVALAAAFHLVASALTYLAGFTFFALWYLTLALVLVSMALFIIKVLNNYAWIKRRRYDYAYA